MMDLEIEKCGTCAGCKLEQERDAFVKELDDEHIKPRLEALARRYDPPGTQVKPDPRSYQSRAIMRERDALMEWRSRVIWAMLKGWGFAAGCCRLIIRTRAA